MRRRVYSWDFKAEVLATYEVDGPAATARLYGMPVWTLKSWATTLGLHTSAETKKATETARAKNEVLRAELRTKLLEKCVDMLGRMDSPHYEYQGRQQERVVYPVAGAKECQSYATALGIMLDKFRLEVGEPAPATKQNITLTVTDEDRRKVEEDVASVIVEAQEIARDAVT